MTIDRESPARAFMRAMRDDALHGPCSLDDATRRAIFEHAGARARGDDTNLPALPDAIRIYVDAIVTDAHGADLEGLQAAGLSDTAIYEITVVAAVAAGSERAVRGLMLLQTALGGLL